MNRLIEIIYFFFGAIFFCPFSDGQGDPEKFEDIAGQLRTTACSAGEKTFNDLAFGVNDKCIPLIKDWIKTKGTYEKVKTDAHVDELFFDCAAFIYDGEMRCLELLNCYDKNQVIKRVNEKDREYIPKFYDVRCDRIGSDLGKTHESYDIMTTYQKNKEMLQCAPEVYEIIKKIAENMSKHVGKKYMKIKLFFYYDFSNYGGALNWHRDCWAGSVRNPDFLAFAVLDMTLPAEKVVSSHAQKIALGLINQYYEDVYAATRGDLGTSPSYEPMDECFEKTVSGRGYMKRSMNNCVKPLRELNNFTGSGYIVDQSMVRRDGKKVVHCRWERDYKADRFSVVMRCYSACSGIEMNRNFGYQKIRSSSGNNTYIAVKRSAVPRG
ncbi:MAG: hypothetical protein QS748_12495 [Candidatus Endonucleobacter bathymodioli]|uniref:Uncharacterized protein n=1 Tax=Candidatus Endonucleibacter bathymodioli TaxID=539814 RepID=A0AA90NNB1_9GAMM|nr:hypothetical protein [Candidatus Endonucleobacter bathymodioli]